MVNRVAVIRVPASTDVPPASIPAPEWTQMRADVNAIAHNTFDPVNYGAKRDDPSEASANVAAIQAAADNAESAGGTLVIKGTFWIDDTVSFRCHVDGTSGTLRTSNGSIAPAVRIGTASAGVRLHNAHIILPKIRQDGKGGLGWSGLDTGLEISNAQSCHITITDVGNFSRGVLVTAYGSGCVYNNVYIGILENNRIGMQLATGDAAGWVNENLFLGGRFHHNSDEGTNVAGTRHILISGATNPINNNVFLKPSVEGNTAQYHVEIGGPYNAFDHARWEASPPKVLLTGTNANSNVVFYGYAAHTIQYTFASGASPGLHHHYGRNNVRLTGETRFTNANSLADPALMVMPTGSAMNAAASGYAARITSNTSDFKRGDDPEPRVRIDHQNSRVQFGDGSAAPDVYLRRFGTAGVQTDKKLLATEGLGTGGYTAGAPSGSPTGSIPIYDANGTLLGRIPVY